MARRRPRAVLRLLTIAGLIVDAVVHLRIAGQYNGVHGTGISEAWLFRIEGFVAIFVALLILLSRHKFVAFVAFVVSASAIGAVLLYRYVNVGPLGPLPNMYDPLWYTEKTVSAIAEGVATLTSLLWLVLPSYKPAATPIAAKANA